MAVLVGAMAPEDTDLVAVTAAWAGVSMEEVVSAWEDMGDGWAKAACPMVRVVEWVAEKGWAAGVRTAQLVPLAVRGAPRCLVASIPGSCGSLISPFDLA